MRPAGVHPTTCLVAAAMLAVASVSAAPPRTADATPLITTDSHLDSAELMAADDDWNWTFRVADNAEKKIAAKSVVRFGRFTQAASGQRVRLVSGGELVGYFVEIGESTVSIESDSVTGSLKLAREAVSAVVFDFPANEADRQSLEKRITAATGETMLFSNGDQLAGQVVQLADDNLVFKATSADLVVDRARVSAVVFANRPARPLGHQSLRTWVGLRDGSRCLAEHLALTGDQLTLVLAGGARVSVKRDLLTALQPLGGDAVYLSDHNDGSYRHLPFLALGWSYQKDRNVTSGPITAGGALHLKGLGMHSAARITYDLPPGFRAFQTELAIDDSAGRRGSVACRVFLDDGSGKWQLRYESPVIRGGQKPIAVEVPLAEARRISLLVDFADHGAVLDRINWLDARLVK